MLAMAPKLFVCLTLLYILPSIPTSFSDYTHSIASAPSSSSSLQSNHGNLDYNRHFSFFLRQKRSDGSRKLTTGDHRGRLAAETSNNIAPAPAAPGPSSVGSNLGAESKKKKSPSAVKWLAGIALGSITGAISAFIASFLFRTIRDYVKRPKPGKPVVFQRKLIDAKALTFLGKAGATEETLELLGRGGSGEVYKAVLENGTAVAIKRIIGMATPLNAGEAGKDHLLENSYDLTKNSAQIHAELNTLGQVRHRNLVKLLAYIPQPTAHLLIYDFMENGSLHDAMVKVAENMLELPWSKRLDIAKDVATGLKYLHLDCNPKIIHCDLKPGNILLDKNMVAHIGDFGLAKVIPDNRASITGNNVAGTVGYIAPEYYQSMKYTTKGDVYGFGVVLVVLLTGKEPTHSMFSHVYSHMGDWVANILAAGVESAVGVLDPQLHGHGDEAEMLLAWKVAAFCLHGDPCERPSADDVLKMLNQIRPAGQSMYKEMELLVGAD